MRLKSLTIFVYDGQKMPPFSGVKGEAVCTPGSPDKCSIKMPEYCGILVAMGELKDGAARLSVEVARNKNARVWFWINKIH